MKVNVEIIRKMNPCTERFDDNFLIYYPNFNSNLEEFLSLDKITYEDKIWVCKKLLNRNQLVHWAVLCAQSVLQIYQNRYPSDNRTKDCIDYLITVSDFSNLNNEQLEKIKNLRSAAADAAYAAAYAADAAYAAAYAADYAYAAAYAADYAADAAYAAYAADAAAYAAADAARKKQQELNLKFLLICSKL